MAKEKKAKAPVIEDAASEKHDLKIDLADRTLYADKTETGLRFYLKRKDDSSSFYDTTFEVTKKDAEKIMEVLL